MAETSPVEKAGIDRKAVVDAWRILLNATRRDEADHQDEHDEGVSQ